MFLKYLYIKNFMLFQELELSFSKQHKVLGILAEYANEVGKSNRAGKSTLIEAITYLLYGTSRVGSRGHKKLVNRAAQLKKEGFVLRGTWELFNGEILQIERSRDYRGGNPIVMVGGHDGAGVDEANKIIAEKTGFTFEEYYNTCYFGQGDIHKFMDSSPSDKRTLLLEWLNQSKWDKFCQVSKDKLKENISKLDSVNIAIEAIPPQQDIKVLEDNIKYLKSQYNICELQIQQNKELEQKLLFELSEAQEQVYLEIGLNDIINDIEELDCYLESAIINKGKIKQLNDEYDRWQNKKEIDINKIDKKIQGLEHQREAKETATKNLQEKQHKEYLEILEIDLNNVVVDHNNKLNKLKVEEEVAFTALKSVLKKIETLNVYTGICPILNEACDRVTNNNNNNLIEEKDQLSKRLRELRGQIVLLLDEHRLYLDDVNNQKLFTIKKLEDNYILELEKLAESYSGKILKLETSRKKQIKECVDACRIIQQELNTIPDEPVEFFENKIAQLENERTKLLKKQKNYRQLDEIKANLHATKNTLNVAQKDLIDISNQLTVLKLDYNTELANNVKRDNLITSQQIYAQNVSAYRYCAYMFGTRGIPQEFIKGSFFNLEEDINYLLYKLNNGLEIEFKPYKISDAYEKSCLVCATEFSGKQRKCSVCGASREKKRTDSIVLHIYDKLENNISTFEQDSGGGKTLISFAVRLALLFLKLRENNVEPMPIILDEIAGMLDGVNREAIMSVVLRVLTEEYNVPQVFWISHEDDIKNALDTNILITRYSDYSVANWM